MQNYENGFKFPLHFMEIRKAQLRSKPDTYVHNVTFFFLSDFFFLFLFFLGGGVLVLNLPSRIQSQNTVISGLQDTSALKVHPQKLA